MTNYLLPENSPFVNGGVFGRYYQRVASALLPEHSSQTLAVVVCLPSFEPEWAIRLFGTHRRGYTVSVSESDSSLWEMSESVGKPSVMQRTVDVTNDFADAMIEALTKMLLTVANVNRSTHIIDGVSYHFIAGGLCGRTSSPYPSTTAGRLVAAIEELCKYVRIHRANATVLQNIQEMFRAVDSIPQYQRSDQVATALKKETEKRVHLYQRGVISDDELVSQLEDAWDYSCYPSLDGIVDLVHCIPDSIRQRILNSHRT